MRNHYEPSDLRTEITSDRTRDDRETVLDEGARPVILVVSQDEANLSLMSTVLGSGRYDYRLARSLGEARSLLASRIVDIVFIEPILQDGAAIELLDELPNLSSHVETVVMSAEQEVEHVTELLRTGACRLISMPDTSVSLAVRLDRVVADWRSRREGSRYQKHLEEMVASTTERLLETLKQVDRLHDLSVEAIGAVFDLRFPETAGHCRRVSENSALIGEAFGLSAAGLRDLRWGAYLHDIGKIAVPDQILAKPGRLTEEEFRIVKEHPVRGVEILSRIDFLGGAKDAVLFHHERYDGTGYPYGLRALEIPLAARIVAVTDTMDAMLQDRPYRAALPYSAVTEHLARLAGIHYDPRVVDKLLQFHEESWFAEPPERV